MQNNKTQLTADEISKLHGEELKKALAEQAAGYRKEISDVDKDLAEVCQSTEGLPEINEKQEDLDDLAAIQQMEDKMGVELNDAVLDLATNDDVLEDLKQ